ncbi:hypothetical protein MKS88_005226 [Plasmodium brasilianum]|uniref:Uncharacterized protein n=1 Tax=Plasmodium brasilianum TaxID=5824 RepID=A0ACB9Y630_PLABR|nr:hypothetical protein MKS88_005226 [Plasmodium brasilianum]
MTTNGPKENENTVALYFKYKYKFQNIAISDTQNINGIGGNPTRICTSITYDNFTTVCQEIGRYLIEINNRYKSHTLKPCKYLHYKINSDENYNKNSDWLERFKTFSSRTNYICKEEIKNIPRNILDNLKELYGYFDGFNK